MLRSRSARKAVDFPRRGNLQCLHVDVQPEGLWSGLLRLLLSALWRREVAGLG
jgi:hypothetical protein